MNLFCIDFHYNGKYGNTFLFRTERKAKAFFNAVGHHSTEKDCTIDEFHTPHLSGVKVKKVITRPDGSTKTAILYTQQTED